MPPPLCKLGLGHLGVCINQSSLYVYRTYLVSMWILKSDHSFHHSNKSRPLQSLPSPLTSWFLFFISFFNISNTNTIGFSLTITFCTKICFLFIKIPPSSFFHSLNKIPPTSFVVGKSKWKMITWGYFVKGTHESLGTYYSCRPTLYCQWFHCSKHYCHCHRHSFSKHARRFFNILDSPGILYFKSNILDA